MPYIDGHRREQMANIFEKLNPHIDTVGDLTYVIYDLCFRYIQRRGHKYVTMAKVVGALQCTISELYRKVIAPYEDEKIKENGDIK